MTAKNIKFEEAMKRLEKIVQEMEGGEMDLERSLALFEEGIKLVRTCQSKLEEAKQKVEVLVKKGDRMEAEPFVPGSPKAGNTDNDLFKE